MTPKATSHVIPLTGKKVCCNGAWWKLFLNIPLYIVTFTTTYINTIEQKDLCNGLTRFACREPEEGVQIWTQFILGVAFKTRQGRRPDILKVDFFCGVKTLVFIFCSRKVQKKTHKKSLTGLWFFTGIWPTTKQFCDFFLAIFNY